MVVQKWEVAVWGPSLPAGAVPCSDVLGGQGSEEECPFTWWQASGQSACAHCCFKPQNPASEHSWLPRASGTGRGPRQTPAEQWPEGPVCLGSASGLERNSRLFLRIK